MKLELHPPQSGGDIDQLKGSALPLRSDQGANNNNRAQLCSQLSRKQQAILEEKFRSSRHLTTLRVQVQRNIPAPPLSVPQGTRTRTVALSSMGTLARHYPAQLWKPPERLNL